MPLSTFLNGGVQLRLRGLAWLALSESGNVLTSTSTDDMGGGASQSWAAGPAIPCRIDPINAFGNSRITGGQLDERSTHVVTAPSGTLVSTRDRLVITGRGIFEVTADRKLTAESVHSFEVIETSTVIYAGAVTTGGTALVIAGATLPALLEGTEYVWMQTDGAGVLLDILSGVA